MIINFHSKPGMIPALTISQPWASLIANGDKQVENRTWKTDYRGPLAIHAGSGTQYLTRNQQAGYPTGGIIAVATLVGCWQVDLLRSTSFSIDEHQWQYIEGPWCWLLEDVLHVDFLPCPGKLGLWTVNQPLVISHDQSPRPIPAAASPQPATPAAERQRKLF